MSATPKIWEARYDYTHSYISGYLGAPKPYSLSEKMAIYTPPSAPRKLLDTLHVFAHDHILEAIEVHIRVDPDVLLACLLDEGPIKLARPNSQMLHLDLGMAGKFSGSYIEICGGMKGNYAEISFSLNEVDWVGDKPKALLDFILKFWLSNLA